MIVKKKTPVKKGGRRTKIETPDENAEPDIPVVQASSVVRSRVSAGELKPTLDETVWRVVTEITPDFETTKDAKLNSDEFAYIIMLMMLTGVSEQQPRRGMTIRNHEFTSEEMPLCREHR